MIAKNHSCNIIISLLVSHGIKQIVLSPGSRNAPIITVAARNKSLNKTVIVDERCAAFVALGMCKATNGSVPVALVCTSGSALLNYAPAIAEAYYHNLPLIVISADRPIEWIDQDDSQTLRQYEALANYVKKSYNIPSTCVSDTQKWFVNRIVNDAIITSNNGKKGPVHINIQLDEPLHQYIGANIDSQRTISMPSIIQTLEDTTIDLLSANVNNKKVLVIAGFQNCEDKYWLSSVTNKLESILNKCPNIVFLSESIANIYIKDGICNIDRVLSQMSADDKDALKPDIIITFGGAIISRFIKQFMRDIPSCQHWHIGITDTTIDCFKKLSYRISIHPNTFINQIYNKLHLSSSIHSYYRKQWIDIARKAEINHNLYMETCEWSDLKAFSIILPKIKGNLHLSNGTPIRYHQLFKHNTKVKKIYCNRGVSGIDGCTSTAIGAALNSCENTILITGDLSAQYDIGALAINNIPPTFKMVVINNGGGGIFKFIGSTSSLPEVDEYLVTKSNLPLDFLAKGFGFEYYLAQNEHELEAAIDPFLECSSKPAILEIITQSSKSAIILSKYLSKN